MFVQRASAAAIALCAIGCGETDKSGRAIGAATYTGQLERDDGDGKLSGLVSISITLNDGYQCLSTYTVSARKP